MRGSAAKRLTSQWLLIDADDTLWENNVHFERVVARFIELVDHPRLSPGQVRSVLDDIERAHFATRGYGSAAFALNLRDAFRALAGDARPERLEELVSLAGAIRQEPLQLIDGVRETLEYLAARHRLMLFSKGEASEQSGKLERSGLTGFFAEVRIVAEKDAAAYRAVVGLGAPEGRTWMVGNSPRSDINPALEAGLKAVWVPHAATWRLEDEQLAGSRQDLLVLTRFSELRDHF